MPGSSGYTWIARTNSTSSLSVRYGHSLTLLDGSLYLFGGTTNDVSNTASEDTYAEYFGDLHVAATTGPDAYAWKKIEQQGDLPKEREGHTTNAFAGQLYLFGGSADHETNLSFNTVHSFNPATNAWTLCKPAGSLPKPRLNHTATDFGVGKVLVFGGYCNREAINDFAVLDIPTMSWSVPSTSGPVPSPRCDHAAASIDSRVYIFGGTAGSDVWLNSLHCLDTATMAWTSINVANPPIARDFCTLIAFPEADGDALVLFAGTTGAQDGDEGDAVHFNDVHVFQSASSNWRLVAPEGKAPAERWGHSAVLVNSEMIVVGGTNDTCDLNDTIALTLPVHVESKVAQLKRTMQIPVGKPSQATPNATKPSEPIAATAAAAATTTTTTTTSTAEAAAPVTAAQSAASSVSPLPRTTPPQVSYAINTPVPAPAPVIIPTVIPSSAVGSDVTAPVDQLEQNMLSTLKQLFETLRAQTAHVDHRLLQLEEDNRALEATRTVQTEIFAQQQQEVEQLIQEHKRDNEAWLAALTSENDVQRAALNAEWADLRNQQAQLVKDREMFTEKSKKMEAIMQQFSSLGQ
ncbi:hypothetical protein CAOG_03617 [Capsaspora owczarzaki ATCC 30864]|uniref:Kelch repeat-containing protein n=1 Tax=Capsaspora owczarzaki (strain ATCC 30864) TaxID=595528 RepID=A0A0D2WPQ7_CAPO3|nr:hypothetical protein CAOG_03617 [Capsaspora owczarzaki ATCC 30864]KJE92703.1 hypothetical protein, variant [Capsaspora owczarzaki ATCC 30864]|eukprot:XP_004363345.1 hypothetical protein CAOG_03617 [Capsaspora owczarzaki ATCC 30864]